MPEYSPKLKKGGLGSMNKSRTIQLVFTVNSPINLKHKLHFFLFYILLTARLEDKSGYTQNKAYAKRTFHTNEQNERLIDLCPNCACIHLSISVT